MIELTSKEIEAVHSTIEMELHPCASGFARQQWRAWIETITQPSRAH